MISNDAMRLLIVDDDRQILRGLSVIIQKFDLPRPCKIITCDNGLDALEVLSTVGADLVITDLEMPGMTGLELIRECRGRQYQTQFIILTGYADFEFARQAIRYQVNDYLLKPVDKKELCELLRKYAESMGGNQPLQPLPPLPIFQLPLERVECSAKMLKILDYIDRHYTMDLSLNLLSEVFHITTGYICILFQQELETTFLHYLDCVRLTHSARMLLGEQSQVIKEIASASGFMNERHFYKVFKKRLEMTPGEFRERYAPGKLSVDKEDRGMIC